MFFKNSPMTGFELRTSGVGIDRSANWASTTAPKWKKNVWTWVESFPAPKKPDNMFLEKRIWADAGWSANDVTKILHNGRTDLNQF